MFHLSTRIKSSYCKTKLTKSSDQVDFRFFDARILVFSTALAKSSEIVQVGESPNISNAKFLISSTEGFCSLAELCNI